MVAKGKKLGRIVHGQPATTNVAFGDDDWKTLFITTRTHLLAVNVNVPGMPVPTPAEIGFTRLCVDLPQHLRSSEGWNPGCFPARRA